ncbi:DUF3948 family protein, partial [Bacillus thuringiensis]
MNEQVLQVTKGDFVGS